MELTLPGDCRVQGSRSPHKWMVAMQCTAFLILLLLGAAAAQARVNVVTLPGRDSVQLTIYNSMDLTLVREMRILTFRKGLNRLEFSWANTLIDPTSVELRAVTHPEAVDVLDVSFPARVTNTLEWRVNSDFAGEVEVEIRYFTSGIRWSADYLVEAGGNEKLMNLSGHVRVTNNSGEDYENAPMSEVLAKDERAKKAVFFGLNEAIATAGAAAKQKEIVKENLSEYFLYTVEGRDTIPNGWSKRLPSFKAADVPITSFYKYEREQWNDRVMRYYRFTNSTPSKLGNEPLPDGTVRAFRFINDEKLYAFVGSTAVKYIPVNEQVDLELGSDLEVRIKPALMT